MENNQSNLKACEFCGEEILIVAKKCKHCGEWFKDQSEGSTSDAKTNQSTRAKQGKLSSLLNEMSPKQKVISVVILMVMAYFLFQFAFHGESSNAQPKETYGWSVSAKSNCQIIDRKFSRNKCTVIYRGKCKRCGITGSEKKISFPADAPIVVGGVGYRMSLRCPPCRVSTDVEIGVKKKGVTGIPNY